MALEGGLWGEVASLFILLLPAMAANGSPVAASRLLRGRSHPIDGGRMWRDGRRLLGDGKTWEGFLVGVATGLIVGLIIGLLARRPSYYCLAGLLGGVGAMLGDIVGSFVKRRLGLERGAPAPILDQLDFYVCALALLWAAGYPVRLEPALVLALVVVALHIGTNALAYVVGLKDRPY